MNHSVQKAIDILKAIAASGELSIADLSKGLGLAKSTVFDIVHTLSDNGLIESTVNDPHKYQLGPALCKIGFSYLKKHQLTEIAWPHLKALHDAEEQTTIYMAVRDKLEMVYVMKLAAKAEIQPTMDVGGYSSIMSTGLGKAALAAMTDEQILQLLPAEVFTQSNTSDVRDYASLFFFLNQARKRGYVLDAASDKGAELWCVAVPILDAHGSYVASISLVSLRETFTDERQMQLGRKLAHAALQISEVLGYTGKSVLEVRERPA